MGVLEIATTFFIVTNPIGNCPTIIALLKNHTIPEQQKILFRESMFSMLLAIFFLILGETFLASFKIEKYALTISGGIILFLLAFDMIFSNKNEQQTEKPKQPPFIVPIATPLLSGAGLLTVIMLFSAQEGNDLKIFFAILIAWIGVTAVLVSAPYSQVFLGKRGLAALEQLMGMLLAMIGIQMLVQGFSLFLTLLSTP
ncbi:MAG: MarC family protein [Candidatus Protochlamydia sp.]|nr:MarC family protein [Candidatus Protochlamydia sp.]